MAQRRAPDPDSFAALGPRVRALREAHGWTEQVLAWHAGVVGKTVVRCERGEMRPRTRILRQIADALAADYAELARLAGYER